MVPLRFVKTHLISAISTETSDPRPKKKMMMKRSTTSNERKIDSSFGPELEAATAAIRC